MSPLRTERSAWTKRFLVGPDHVRRGLPIKKRICAPVSAGIGEKMSVLDHPARAATNKSCVQQASSLFPNR